MTSHVDPDDPGFLPAPAGLDPYDIDYLRGRAETVPGDWTRWFRLGSRYLLYGETQLAEAAFARTVQLAPANGLAMYFYASSLAQNEKWEQAGTALRRATRLRPDLASAWKLLSAYEQRRGRYRAAISALRHVARLAPSGEVYWELGDCLLRVGKVRHATVVLEHAVALQPNHLLAHRDLVLIGIARGDDALARRHRQLLFEFNEDRARKFEEQFEAFERRLAESRARPKSLLHALLTRIMVEVPARAVELGATLRAKLGRR